MLPKMTKDKDFHDLSIGDIRTIRFSGHELHEFIECHRYRPTSDHLSGYQVPVQKKSQHRKNKPWYSK
jgi:hypothetical protein